MKNIEKFYGCLVGGAAGDALGYEVEFDSERNIRARYGPRGIHQYALTNGKAVVSDDTQMTFFTANGLLLAAAQTESTSYAESLSLAYREWLLTQTKEHPLEESGRCWLLQEKRLFRRRAPGNTCLAYCTAGAKGSVEHPENNSCGCGGVMRVAPIGLMFDNKVYTQDWIDMLGAQAAAMTHGHPLGYIPAAALVHLVNRMTYDDISLRDAAFDTISAMQRLFRDTDFCEEFIQMMRRAVDMSEADLLPLDCIHALGEGWTGHEAFAIALYCALKSEDDFDMALRTAVNHDGDSDSTGAITGNILGTYLGITKIPEKYIENLEMIEVAWKLAEDLYTAGEPDSRRDWTANYRT